ncbi:hypothetical protein F5Y06DRAFT_273839 [Hypoxylon sp. FL0890]|nr:hypothetical protein F5Y06DRAFT_273839 [Hypoxylon sp. FL0890]
MHDREHVRALLRAQQAQQAQNREQHQHAFYLDGGKLLCKVCHEQVPTEDQWDAHTQTATHVQRLETLQSQPGSGFERPVPPKRKRTEAVAKKPVKTENLSSTDDDGSDYDYADEPPLKRHMTRRDAQQSPPATLDRRASNTPVQGVEIAIPSRPATPAAGSNSATSTPMGMPVGRSPLIGSETTSTTTSTPSTQQHQAISTQALAVPASTAASASATASATSGTQAAANAVDEAEWAAFEAEVANAPEAAAPTALEALSSTAAITAPALTAAQLAAQSQDEEHERQNLLLTGEREDTSLARLAELDHMEELEGRVRRLKERREQVHKMSVANLRGATATTATTTSGVQGGEGPDSDVVMAKGPAAEDKENDATGAVHEDQDDEDDDEEDEGWDVFRFH